MRGLPRTQRARASPADQSAIDAVRRQGAKLAQCIERCAAKGLGDVDFSVRGQGLLWALVLDAPLASEICQAAFDEGLLINPAQPGVVRFMPPLRLGDADLDEFEARFTATLSRVGSPVRQARAPLV